MESLVVYPGFNAAVPDGVSDDHRLLRMPPMMSHQQLDFATSTMKTPKPVPYKRIKITSPDQSRALKQDADDDGPTTKEILQMIESREKNEEEGESPAAKLIQVGVGVPVSYNVKKPPLEKWSENNSLSELIYFENLPNYTGVFNKMRTVLGGVRSKLFGSSKTPADEKVEDGIEAAADASVITLRDGGDDDDDATHEASGGGKDVTDDGLAQNSS